MSVHVPSTKRNYIYLYLSQVYILAVGVVIVPFHLKYLGVAAYGLIGFYTTIQVLFQMLDVGMTPTLSREAARFHVGVVGHAKAKSFLRVLEFVFFAVTLVIFLLAYLSSGAIAEGWFSSSYLPQVVIQEAFFYLTLVAGVRWYSGLYRAFIAGFENQVWLSKLNMAITTLRFVGVLPVLMLYEPSIVVFFKYQLIVAAAELILLMRKSSTYLKIKWLYFPGFSDVFELKSTFKLSFTAGGAGLIWVFASQSDKLLLSKLLPLEEFGYFSMAALLVNGVMVITAPITKVALPKLTKLSGIASDGEFYGLYLNTSKNIVRLAFLISVFFCFYSHEIVYIWTASKQVADEIFVLVALYALGNSFLAASSLTYYLQMAKGDLKFHVVGVFLYLVGINTFLFLFVPAFGLDGAGYAWLLVNVLYFFFWCSFVVGKFNKSVVKSVFLWGFFRVLIPIVIVLFLTYLLWMVLGAESYFFTIVYLAVAFATAACVVLLVGAETRLVLFSIFNGLKIKIKRLKSG